MKGKFLRFRAGSASRTPNPNETERVPSRLFRDRRPSSDLQAQPFSHGQHRRHSGGATPASPQQYARQPRASHLEHPLSNVAERDLLPQQSSDDEGEPSFRTRIHEGMDNASFPMPSSSHLPISQPKQSPSDPRVNFHMRHEDSESHEGQASSEDQEDIASKDPSVKKMSEFFDQQWHLQHKLLKELTVKKANLRRQRNEARRNARRDIAQISHDLEESEAQLKSSIESKEMAESQVDNLQQKIQSLEHARHEEKQNYEQSIQEKREEVLLLSDKLTTSTEENKSMEAENSKVMKERNFIERKFEEEICRREEVQLKLQELQAEMHQSTTEKDDLYNQLKQSEKNKQILYQQLQEAQKENKSIDNLRSVQSERLQGLQKRLELEIGLHLEKNKQLELNLNDLQSKQHDLQNERDLARKDRDSAQREILHCKEKVKELEKEALGFFWDICVTLKGLRHLMNPQNDSIPKEFDRRFLTLLVNSQMTWDENEAIDVVCSIVDKDEELDWSTDVSSNLRVVSNLLRELTETLSNKYHVVIHMVVEQHEIYQRFINGWKRIQTTFRELRDSEEDCSKIIRDLIAIEEEDKSMFTRFCQLAQKLERESEHLRVENEKERKEREAIESELKRKAEHEVAINRKSNEAMEDKRRELEDLNDKLKERSASLKKAEADMEEATRFAHEKTEEVSKIKFKMDKSNAAKEEAIKSKEDVEMQLKKAQADLLAKGEELERVSGMNSREALEKEPSSVRNHDGDVPESTGNTAKPARKQENTGADMARTNVRTGNTDRVRAGSGKPRFSVIMGDEIGGSSTRRKKDDEPRKRQSQKAAPGKPRKRAASRPKENEQPKTKGSKKSAAQASDDDHEWDFAMFDDDCNWLK